MNIIQPISSLYYYISLGTCNLASCISLYKLLYCHMLNIWILWSTQQLYILKEYVSIVVVFIHDKHASSQAKILDYNTSINIPPYVHVKLNLTIGSTTKSTLHSQGRGEQIRPSSQEFLIKIIKNSIGKSSFMFKFLFK